MLSRSDKAERYITFALLTTNIEVAELTNGASTSAARCGIAERGYLMRAVADDKNMVVQYWLVRCFL